jgi:O-acetyl-ADP-ribose deacetylase (regulator of RNase III)
MTRIVLQEGDITQQEVDAIVNAANSALVLGSGVAGAVAERGGASIGEECRALGPIEVGEAVVTGAGDLSARIVIHAAAMPPRGRASEQSVRASLRAALVLANREGCRTVACPAIGAGVGGLSMQTCAEISLDEARRFDQQHRQDPQDPQDQEGGRLEEIRFVLFGEPAFRIFEMVNDAAKVEAQMRKLQDR